VGPHVVRGIVRYNVTEFYNITSTNTYFIHYNGSKIWLSEERPDEPINLREVMVLYDKKVSIQKFIPPSKLML
jgi:hypothetical protein